MSKKTFQKKYFLKDLLCSKKILSSRIEKIHYLSDSEYLVPKTNITIKDKYLIYEQKHLKKKLQSIVNEKELFFQLANTLEVFEDIGFIHGDIVQRNIIYNKENFYLIDLEPCLHQIKYGRKVVCFTPPYVSTKDLDNLSLTSETDKIGFFFFILRKRGILTAKIIALLFHYRIRLNQSILPIDENEFFSLNYKEIVLYAFNFSPEIIENNGKITYSIF